jgi:syntaxin 6
MLDEMDDDLDKVTEKMNTVMGALSKLLKTKDKCQLWGVIVLFIILIILVGLVIYT